MSKRRYGRRAVGPFLREKNICFQTELVKGDVDKAFAEWMKFSKIVSSSR